MPGETSQNTVRKGQKKEEINQEGRESSTFPSLNQSKMTKKEKIMGLLVDAGASADELNWASSHIPSTDEQGKVVPEGLTFKGLKYEHASDSTAEAVGMDRARFKILARKLEDTVDRLHGEGGCDGKHKCPSQSQITEAMLPQLNDLEAAFLILRGIDSINSASPSHSLSQPMGEGMPSLEDLMRMVREGKARVGGIEITKIEGSKRKKKTPTRRKKREE